MLELYFKSRWAVAIIILGQSLALCPNVIEAHVPTNFRCSHVPPTPDLVTHVWLNDANFSAGANQDSASDDGANWMSDSNNQMSEEARSKRHINSRRNSRVFDSLESSFLNLPGAFKNPKDNDDLIPVRIRVHYDTSVYALEDEKIDLITNSVMPSVIKFFENVLSIRKKYAIQRFRMSRRCPNNTIYYARKDIIGHSRPFCMDRCENYAACGEIIVPSDHLSACSYCNTTSSKCLTNLATEGKGVSNTQLMLYVSAKQTSRCRKDQTIAYAAHCAQDPESERPIAGHANLCPSSISTHPKDLKALVATVKHELTHVLGFSVSLFAYYRDESGRPLTERDSIPGPIPVDPRTGYARWSEKVIRKIVRADWLTGAGKVEKEVHLVVTPTVVREVRRHFNCSTLEGAELEDQGSDGTSMTHWEKRLFENEAMTGTHTQNSVYSRLTLAVLQDTGWYVANFSRAEKLDWGENMGCNFAKKSCKSWIDERRANNISIRPFCDRIKGDLLQISCTDDRNSKAVCNMKQYNEPLPMHYQNFDQLEGISKDNLAHYGGSVDLADYCPFIQEFTWQAQNVTVRGSRCELGGNNLEPERNAALEHYGSHTKCFEHGKRWEQRSCVYKRHWHHFGAGCYKYQCLNGHVVVMVGNYSYPCYYPNQLVTIQQQVDQWLYNGTLLCPACAHVCPSSKCTKFDRGLVDKIINLYHITAHDSSKEEILRAILDDALNTLDIEGNMLDIDQLMIEKQKPNEIAITNKSILADKFKDYHKYKNHLFHIFSQYEKPPKDWLVCSSANSLATFHLSLWIVSVAMYFLLL